MTVYWYSIRLFSDLKQCFFLNMRTLQSPDIYTTYMEELKNSRISYKECPEFLLVVLEHSSGNLVLFDHWRVRIIDY